MTTNAVIVLLLMCLSTKPADPVVCDRAVAAAEQSADPKITDMIEAVLTHRYGVKA